MDASAFWKVIGEYNQKTWVLQIVILGILIGSVVITLLTKYKWICKVVLGLVNLYIAFAFFAAYGTEPIQKYFALPLYLGVGGLFIYESIKNKNDQLQKPDVVALSLAVLYIIYPLVSMLFGARFPKMVTNIMPCPVVTVSIAIYSCYRKKNLPLLVLLTIWGLTGVKSVIFAAYEDIILLFAGFYGVYLIVREMKNKRSHHSKEAEKCS